VKLYAIKRPDGTLIQTYGPTKTDAWRYAASIDDGLLALLPSWTYIDPRRANRHGYRCVRVKIVEITDTTAPDGEGEKS